ncbi:hypothetical protein LINGRAHAP2_LOCUS7564 [Linum grandiflorum]
MHTHKHLQHLFY